MKQLLLIALLFISSTTYCATRDGVTLPDSININGEKLLLNGLGTRKATWFKVKVYVGGLYLKKKSTNAKIVMQQPFPKFINMHFVRDVDKDKLVGGWNDAYEAALNKEQLKKLKPLLEKFNATMHDIKEGEEIHLTFLNDGIKVKFANKAEQFIPGKTIAAAIFSVWFVNPGDEGLRDGLLGLQ